MAASASEWLVHIPEGPRSRAYRADGEFAWSRDDAIRVAEVLRNKGFAVIGVDIWLPTDPGPTIPTPFVYDWSQEAGRVGAVDFIGDFKWADEDSRHKDLEPYFNLTVVPLDA